MDRSAVFPIRPAPRRPLGPGLCGFVGPVMCVALLALDGCAGATSPTVNSAALAQQAYANNGTIRSVSDALDQRLSLMLAVRTAGLQQ